MSDPSCVACRSTASRCAFEASDWYLGEGRESFAYRRCEDCGTIFMNPQVDDATLANAYAKGYWSHSSRPSMVERIGEPLAQREAARLTAAADRTTVLLDIGCGRGTFLRRLRHAGWQGPLRGLERDAEVAARTAEEIGVPVQAGTLDDVALEPGAMGTVVMRHVIEHVRDPRETLARVTEALTPGGMFYVATPDARALAAGVFGRYWPGYDPPRHLFAFTSTGMRRLLADAGFTIVAENWFFAPQMWTGSLRNALGHGTSRGRSWARWVAHDLNPLVAVPAAAAAAIEVALDRSMMYAATARKDA